MKKSDLNKLLFGCNYCFIVLGMGVVALGALMPYLRQEFGVNYNQGGILLFIQSFGNLISSTIGGFISDKIGRKVVMISGGVFLILGFGGMLAAPSSSFFYAAILIIGLGWGIFNFGINAIVSDATDGDGTKLTILHIFFAIGALISPFIVAFLIYTGLGWKAFPILMIIMSAILTICMAVIPIPNINKTENNKTSDWYFLKNIRFYIFTLILFLYVGAENSVNGWLVTYLNDNNIVGEIFSQYFLSFFWLVIIGGRIIGTKINKHYKKESILLFSSIGGFVFFILFLLIKNPIVMFLLIIGIGISFANVYPTTVANASITVRNSGTASGVMMSLGGFGGAVVPWLNGVVAQSKGISSGMIVIVISTGLLLFMTIMNYAKREW